MSEEEEILKDNKVIAVVGLSSNPERPSFRVASYLKGKGYKIMTLPKEDRIPEISIRMASEKEFRKRGRKGDADFLADARIDKDLFGSTSGDIEIFFTRDMLPVQAIAKGIILFGDVKGKLREVVPGGALKKASNLSFVLSNP